MKNSEQCLARMREVVYFPVNTHKATLIFLHGFSDTPQSYEDIVQAAGLDEGWKVIIPHAPYIDDWYGEAGPSWYYFERKRHGPVDKPDKETLASTTETLQAILQREREILPDGKLYLGGSSQGCGMALHAASISKVLLEGFIGIRGTKLAITDPSKLDTVNRLIFFYGTLDNVILPRHTRSAVKKIQVTGRRAIAIPLKGYDHDIGEIEFSCIRVAIEK